MLTPKQQRGLAAMLANPTRDTAAKASGISVRTLRRYEVDCPEYAEALENARRGAIIDAMHSIAATYPQAVETLRQVAANEKAQDGARVAACRALLEYGLKFTELGDIEKRLAALEDGDRVRYFAPTA